MTRKLHNTLMAIIASSSLLVVGIIASSPIASELETATAVAVVASIDSQLGISADAIKRTAPAPVRQTRAVRQRRQTLAMPFYSFAPRS